MEQEVLLMRACDFRAAARRALSGKWMLAVLTGLIATLLGGASSSGVDFEINFENGSAYATAQVGMFDFEISPAVFAFFSYTLIAALVSGLLFYLLGSVIRLGYARFNLNLVDGEQAEISDLFGYISWFKTAFCARFLVDLYTLLWSLLLIFPGIIAAYSYAMTSYILAEHPELTAREAISRSKQLMAGNRWRLFCLDFSFIGWRLLSILTLGIGSLWLDPYVQAATAAFYRDLTAPQQPFPVWEN